MNAKVILAVFKRNFVNYFSSPTGYVFICVFVTLSGFAAFWPDDFFATNRANLDQLNYWFPFIMLIFIPAITMSIWAEERRQGTDELLLTLPASDFEIVLGKYLAALSIFSVSLLFSLICNLWVLRFLGDPDTGLFLSTYFGYWLVGLAMLAVGMAASFFTANITVAYVLGALLNAPLVLAVWAHAIFAGDVALAVRDCSITAQFAEFGRGIVNTGGLAYFLLIAAVMLYVSMVLIGRRLWHGGQVTLPDALYYPLGIFAWVGCAVAISGVISLIFWPEWDAFLLTFLATALLLVVGLMISVALLETSWFPRRMALMPLHYMVRVGALLVAAASLTVLFYTFSGRIDCTDEQLSSLSGDTVTLLENLDAENPVYVDAFVSEDVPDVYRQTRLELLAMLKELDNRGGQNVRVRVNDTERFSDEAERAEKRYGIGHRRVMSESRGIMEEEDIYLGVAFTCGLEKVILPFVDRGIPIEYELVRSISTVVQQERKKIGVVRTDASVFGQFSMQARSSRWPIIDELEKQYDVVEVDPSSPITDEYDVLLAVQPSSLGPEEMNHFLAAVGSGQPTAVFEDPMPFFAGGVPATSEPRQPAGGGNPMFGGGQPQPKGDISPLWRMLGVDFMAAQIVWQDYNPFPKVSRFDEVPEFVFVEEATGATEPFSEASPITSRLQRMLFPFSGSISELNVSAMDFTPLIRTGPESGTVSQSEMMYRPLGPFGPADLDPRRKHTAGAGDYILAARITGSAPDAGLIDPADDEEEDDGNTLDVVLVADIDMLTGAFFQLREQGQIPGAGLHFDFDNVTFVLNLLDELADDDRFIELRKRRPQHRPLTRIDQLMEAARKATRKARREQQEQVDEAEKKEQGILDDEIKQLREDMQQRAMSDAEITNRIDMKRNAGQRRLNDMVEELEQQRDKKIDEIETKRKNEVRQLQDRYKLMAVGLPPLLPLALALIVLLTRRSRERKSVSQTRLRP